LGDEIGEVEGGVDTDGCEGGSGVGCCWEGGLGDDPKVGDDVLKPGGCREEGMKPLACGTLGIFVAVED